MDKEKIEQLILKIKRAYRLMKSVDSEIGTCRVRCEWFVHKISDFKQVCHTLGISYTAEHTSVGTLHLETEYNGVKIFTVEILKGGNDEV